MPLSLVIGNKNYSSWSLRPWIALRQAGIAFNEVLVPLDQADTGANIAAWSPAGRVPVLIHNDLHIWDSLAILEYLAEIFPDKGLWPRDARARARARSIAAEMHSGFAAIRSAMPMNCRARLPGLGATPEAGRDIARIVDIWTACRAEFGAGGEFLFGAFSNADACFAPVTSRLLTYAVKLPPVAANYVSAVQQLPAMQAWVAAARDELWVIATDEPYAVSAAARPA
ncbi:MAG TPA: glutathione S-transferase family protein [Usitatibacteraceae bacterium]